MAAHCRPVSASRETIVETGRLAALFVEQRHPNRASAIMARHRQYLSLDQLEPVLRHEPASLDHPRDEKLAVENFGDEMLGHAT